MKKALFFLLLLNIISFVFIVFSALAGHDIFNEYVSRQKPVIGFIKKIDLPAYTNCSLEWNILNIDFVFRLLFFLLSFIVLLILIINPPKTR